MRSQPETTQTRMAGRLRWVGLGLYAALIVASFATLSDWRFRAVTVVVIASFAVRTLLRPRPRDEVSAWDRPADRPADEL